MTRRRGEPAAGRGRPPSHDQAVVDEAVALYRSGKTQREVAAVFAGRGISIHPTTIGYWAGDSPRKRGPRGRDDIDEGLMLRLLEDGWTPTSIGQYMGLPRTTVRQRLAALSGEPRPGRAPKAVRARLAVTPAGEMEEFAEQLAWDEANR